MKYNIRRINGLRIGDRKINESDQLFCKMCNSFKDTTDFSTKGDYYAQNCKPCEAERVSYLHLKRQIEERGIDAVIDDINKTEIELKNRKRRLNRYLGES